MDAGIKSGADGFPAVQSAFRIGKKAFGTLGCRSRLAFQFGAREGEQVQHSGPAGERLGDPFHQEEILRSGEDESPRCVVVVHRGLQVGEKVGHTLGFVNDHEPGIPFDEAAWVVAGELALVEVLQRDIRILGKTVPCQSRLARLPGARQGYDRIVFRVAF